MLHGINLDRESRLSLRRQLVGHLESRILAGHIGPGHRLPSVRRAEELLGVHRNTVAAAYRDLVRAGLVRSRPGSGVYVRLSRREDCPATASVIVRGPRSVELVCLDPDLETILAAELRVRLGLRVSTSAGEAHAGTVLLLSPSMEFLQLIRSLPRPSIVAVISQSEVVHRMASIAALIHGGEGLAYLPAFRAKRQDLERLYRLTRNIAADYASLSLATGPPHGYRNRGTIPASRCPRTLIRCGESSIIGPLIRTAALARGVIGNTLGSGPRESRFEPWRANRGRERGGVLPALAFLFGSRT